MNEDIEVLPATHHYRICESVESAFAIEYSRQQVSEEATRYVPLVDKAFPAHSPNG